MWFPSACCGIITPLLSAQTELLPLRDMPTSAAPANNADMPIFNEGSVRKNLCTRPTFGDGKDGALVARAVRFFSRTESKSSW
jgi:hypothetical protein